LLLVAVVAVFFSFFPRSCVFSHSSLYRRPRFVLSRLLPPPRAFCSNFVGFSILHFSNIVVQRVFCFRPSWAFKLSHRVLLFSSLSDVSLPSLRSLPCSLLHGIIHGHGDTTKK
jgi:hypothetical protein